MLNKDNIMGIIADHQKKIDALNSEIEKSTSDIAISAMQNELSFLCDNQYRYKLQAKAWGMISSLN